MKLQLQSGRWIQLSSLDQHHTYAGLLAGRPIRLMNDNKIEDLLQKARRESPDLGEPLFIAPPSRSQVVPGPPMDEERLPGVTCLAVFDSDELNKADPEPFSSLMVLWFQDDFAMPIDSRVLFQLELVDWELRATDWMP